ncbi:MULTISPECIES: heavy metal sensor histidine kinase [Ralstonia]|jgi:two-component system heavy metal sensor histidine kinase CusS|uniref:Sensor protein n=2 Tax=Ralstonia TaxID=48736 RepID=A0AAD2BTU4_9RALS|nr:MULTISPECIES: heavy metal sensor histidine kinase [Ralstonia]NOZ15219.1 heavy metal sensor histidine kinase [Betaproteobacteria bacterium]MCK8653300.1 heavy metal sensor histidine kinase [Ralstonia insidiosa]MCL6456054.1 heavy metal sensor histidine kinase [Ralstonia pickettii]NOZ99181.1 heavy metal sensor histidine kinase [Betaproteobacteria bacterium]NYS10890.1 heavy metal sensor histidine kinase [Ralstonia pickettii]
MGRFSLTTRLTAYFSLCSAAVLLGLGVVIALAMDQHFAVEDYTALRENVSVIEKIVESSPATQVPERIREALQHRTDLVARIQGSDRRILYVTKDFDFRAAAQALAQLRRKSDALVWEQGVQQYRGMHAAIPMRDGSSGALDVLLGINTDIHAHFLHTFRGTLAFYIAVAALATGLFGWWAARHGLAPLRTMASRAQTVTADKLDERMPVDTVPVEVADLAATLNAMLERLQNDFRRLSDFSTDIAHELRTPITNLLTQTEVVLSQPREGTKYRDVLTSNAEELQRLARMVSDMLYLAKMEHSLTLPSAEDIRIADEIRALFEFYDALAEDKAVQLELRGDGHVVGDRLMLRRALSNLLSNAIRHTPRLGHVVVSVSDEREGVTISVDNDGNEIPPHLLPFLFERFFRADKSRARPESESAGLGLAITKAIVVAHGGAITVSRIDERTRFSVRLPHRAEVSDALA